MNNEKEVAKAVENMEKVAAQQEQLDRKLYRAGVWVAAGGFLAGALAGILGLKGADLFGKISNAQASIANVTNDVAMLREEIRNADGMLRMNANAFVQSAITERLKPINLTLLNPNEKGGPTSAGNASLFYFVETGSDSPPFVSLARDIQYQTPPAIMARASTRGEWLTKLRPDAQISSADAVTKGVEIVVYGTPKQNATNRIQAEITLFQLNATNSDSVLQGIDPRPVK